MPILGRCIPRRAFGESRTRALLAPRSWPAGQEIDASHTSLQVPGGDVPLAQSSKRLEAEGVAAVVAENVAPKTIKSRALYRMAGAQAMVPMGRAKGARVQQAMTTADTQATATATSGKSGKEGREPTVGWLTPSTTVGEDCGDAVVTLTRGGDTSGPLSVKVSTKEGTATSGADYKPLENEVVTFAAGQATAEVKVPIVDDLEIEDEEEFTVHIAEGTDPAGVAVLSEGVHRVFIQDNDSPGMFVFVREIIKVQESDGVAVVQVQRAKGRSGEVSLKYKTLSGSAVADKDFTPVEGTLTWPHAEAGVRDIEVPIARTTNWESVEYFEVEIGEASGGAYFDEKRDGDRVRSIARVKIHQDEMKKTMKDRLVKMLSINADKIELGTTSWKQQFTEALDPGEEPGLFTLVMHAISLPWKLWAALIPPTDLGSGYPCFVTSLVFVGILTAWIGDLANLLGCVVGLKSSIVAFTFVALGTSLPDTFASRTAALGDDTADNAVGNVTGSNAVNVFLGLGLSWVVGSIYWYVNGADEAYIKRYPDIAEKYDIKVGDSVGLAVRATDTSLAFNITVFTAFATVAIGLLAWRRKQFGCELGGPFRWPTFGILVSFWLMYVLLSALVADGVFEAF